MVKRMKDELFHIRPSDKPTQWYQILADFNEPLPPIRYGEDVKLSKLEHEKIRVKELVKQDTNTSRYVDIPKEVIEKYEMCGRDTPLMRAYSLEQYIGTCAEIYVKREDVLPTHSFKLNSALAQVYYAKQEGFERVVSETGAGQWGLALSYAAKVFGMKADIFWVRSSMVQKPYRADWSSFFQAIIHASPSEETETGRIELGKDCECPGSLGIAIGEAVEYVRKQKNCAYISGSNLPDVILHQSIIGLETKKQLLQIGVKPDFFVACCGGGSNLGGFMGPFFFDEQYKNVRFLAAESDVAPRLTKGEYRYDYPDPLCILPQVKSYTLGKDYMPPVTHVGGLRQHNGSAVIGWLRNKGMLQAESFSQEEALKAGKLFANLYGVIPAPESSHALAAAIKRALYAKKMKKKEVIVLCLSGCGVLDMQAYIEGGR